jgi:hypothetical protein
MESGNTGCNGNAVKSRLTTPSRTHYLLRCVGESSLLVFMSRFDTSEKKKNLALSPSSNLSQDSSFEFM